MSLFLNEVSEVTTPYLLKVKTSTGTTVRSEVYQSSTVSVLNLVWSDLKFRYEKVGVTR